MALFEVVFQGVWYSQQVVTRRFYEATAFSTSQQAVADAMGEIWSTDHLPIVASSLTMEQISFRRLDIAAPGIPYTPSDWPYAGALATDAMPAYTAVDVVLFGVEARYPNRGRVRLPGAVEAQQAGGNLTAGALVLWQAFAAFFAQTITTSGSGIWVPVLHSEVYSPDNEIQVAVVNELLTTQNTRKIGRGS